MIFAGWELHSSKKTKPYSAELSAHSKTEAMPSTEAVWDIVQS